MCDARYFHNNKKVLGLSSVTKKDPPPEKNPTKNKTQNQGKQYLLP